MTKKQITNRELKRKIVEVSYKLGLSHIGSCLAEIDLLKYIYDIKKPDDLVVLDNAHAHLAHLVVQGYTEQEVIDFIKEVGIHCDRKALCDVSGGSLGHSVGISLGLALANRKRQVWCTLSDGSVREGSCWETFRIQKEQLVDNLNLFCVINGWGAYHKVDVEQLIKELEFMSWCNPVIVDMSMYPEWLTTQEAHYGILDKKRYDELMKILK